MSDQNLPHRLHSDRPLRNVSTLKHWHESRIDGAVIINRLSRTGMFDVMSAGAFKIVTSMANIFGVKVEHSKGLLVRKKDLEKEVALRIRLSRAVGLAEQSNYAPIRELERLKIIERIPRGNGDDFVLIMPDEPIGGSPEMEDDEPLQDCRPDNSAMQDARATSLHDPNSVLQDCQPDNSAMRNARANGERKIVKSDSGGQNRPARASCNGTQIALSLAKLSEAKLKALGKGEKLKDGRTVARILMEDGGFRAHIAQALAKKPNATFRQVTGAIRLCNQAEDEFKSGKRKNPVGNRESFITIAINEMWEVPPDEVEQALENLPEYQQEEIQPALEVELAENPAVKIETAVLALAKPVENKRIELLATQVREAAPDAARDLELARKAAEASKQKILLDGRREEESFALGKRKLAALGPEMLLVLTDKAITAEPSEFLKERYKRSRSEPLGSRALVMAMMRILEGEQP